MGDVDSFAALYGNCARTCIEMSIRPLLPEEFAALLERLDVLDDRALH